MPAASQSEPSLSPTGSQSGRLRVRGGAGANGPGTVTVTVTAAGSRRHESLSLQPECPAVGVTVPGESEPDSDSVSALPRRGGRHWLCRHSGQSARPRPAAGPTVGLLGAQSGSTVTRSTGATQVRLRRSP